MFGKEFPVAKEAKAGLFALSKAYIGETLVKPVRPEPVEG